ncbi:hypothetical protein GCM10010421_10480 [Streptomyces glaucus]|uniref:Transposase n=1 Tax=Streptomyces glaucus TaxID=284029 RepID=A0ABN3JC70_9ACTN
MRISHEAIYQSLHVESRGRLKHELVACPRTGRTLRVPRARARNKPGGHVTKNVMISQQPAEAADRAVPGHREKDLTHRAEPAGDRHARTANNPLHHACSPATHREPPQPSHRPRTAPHRAATVP